MVTQLHDMTTVMSKNADRVVFRIAVSPRAKATIKSWAARMDMKETGVASRIYEWFGMQPEVLQRGILGMFGDQTPDLVKLALEKLGVAQGEAPAAPDPEQSHAEGLAEARKDKQSRRGRAG